MKEKISKEDLANLVLFELEKYCKTVTNHPLISDDANYAELRTNKAHFHRAIHWYLNDNGLVYQDKGLVLDTFEQKYSVMWFLKEFDKEKACKEIIEKYEEYLNISPYAEKIECIVNHTLENALKDKGKDEELSRIFEELNKKYESNADLIIAEYNKLMMNIYAEIFYKK